jgi:hypothetical protein
MVEAPGLRGAHKKEKPASVMDYNKHKIGVDKSDQMLLNHSFQTKYIKSWIQTSILLDLSVVNAHVLYHKASKSKLKLISF